MKKITNTIAVILISLLAICTIYFSYSIYLYKGIEDFYRYYIIVLLLYFAFFSSYGIIRNIKTKNFKLYIVSCIISFILIVSFVLATRFIYSVYNKINNFNKDVVTYSTSLITLNDKYKNIKDIKNTKIGIVDDETNYESNILALEYIDANKLDKNNEIVKFESSLELLDALFSEEVDLIFISGNYLDLYGNDEYSDVNDDIIEIDNYSKKYNKEDVEKEITSNTTNKLDKPFTILLLGVDSEKDGLDKNAAFNGDTIMLISFNPKTLQATMFSIPRDTYVPITCSGNTLKKINTSAYGGVSCVINTVTKFTGINIDYYVKINFRGVIDLVNAIDGITVDIPKDFCESNSQREQGDKEICLKKGLQNINGDQALAFARNRHDFGSDFIRGQNQQTIVEAIMNKAKTIKNISKVYGILDTISKNIDTNLSTSQLLSFYDILKSLAFSKQNNVVNIQKTFLRGYDLYVYEPSSKHETYAFFNYKGSLNDITDAMKITLGIKEAEMIKEFDFSINKTYKRVVIGDHGYNESRQAVLPNFKTYTIQSARQWANNNNLKFIVQDYSSKETITNYENYIIVGQKEPQKTLVSRINSVTIYVTENTSDSSKEE